MYQVIVRYCFIHSFTGSVVNKYASVTTLLIISTIRNTSADSVSPLDVVGRGVPNMLSSYFLTSRKVKISYTRGVLTVKS